MRVKTLAMLSEKKRDACLASSYLAVADITVRHSRECHCIRGYARDGD